MARIVVKLSSQPGIGILAAGAVRAGPTASCSPEPPGGTGTSWLDTREHAGSPWELGLAEAQQTLLLNKLRDRVTVQVDGQLKTGRDVVIAALLGAEEFGFATAPLIVSGLYRSETRFRLRGLGILVDQPVEDAPSAYPHGG
jgi:glutamate synthase (NADPH) large chain